MLNRGRRGLLRGVENPITARYPVARGYLCQGQGISPLSHVSGAAPKVGPGGSLEIEANIGACTSGGASPMGILADLREWS